MIWRSKRPGTQQRRIEHIGAVGRGDDDHAFLRVEAIHLDEQRIERLLALIMPAAHAMAAMPAHGVDLIDENNARRALLALLEHVAHAARADADKHFHEVRTADREKRHIGLAGNRASQERLARSRRADQEHAFRDAAAEFLELLRIAQELDQLGHFVLRFLDAGDVLEGDLVLVAREHARLRLAEVERALAGHADLLAEEEVEHEQEKRDREEAHERLHPDVRVALDRGLNPGLAQLILQVRVVVQENGRAEGDLRGLVRAGRLADVIAAERLRGHTLLDHQLEREVFVVRDLLVFQQLEEAIVRHILHVGVGAAAEEHREGNEGESDGDQDHAAPVETGVGAAGFVLLFRVAIWLGHKR